MLRQTFSVFEPEKCLEMGNYKYTVLIKILSYFGRWNWCFFGLLFWYTMFILCFVCVTIVNREMKNVSAI